jgi:hypothetical protein
LIAVSASARVDVENVFVTGTALVDVAIINNPICQGNPNRKRLLSVSDMNLI